MREKINERKIKEKKIKGRKNSIPFFNLPFKEYTVFDFFS